MGGAMPPCGSWRVLRVIEGHEAEAVWCDRREGPCPYAGTVTARDAGSGRPCAVAPSKGEGEVAIR
jgi:hypothetical protein